MPVRISAWPIEAFPFEGIDTPVVESFLDAEERGAFDFRRSVIQQLYDHVDLGRYAAGRLIDSLDPRSARRTQLPGKLQFGFREPRSVIGDDRWQVAE